MATKAKENEEVEVEREGAPDGPLLDLSDDAVKKMIKLAKKRGYVTMDELNAVLPSEEVTLQKSNRWDDVERGVIVAADGNEMHARHAGKRPFECFRPRQVALDHLDAGRQIGALRIAGERPHEIAVFQQFIDDVPADIARRACHKKPFCLKQPEKLCVCKSFDIGQHACS